MPKTLRTILLVLLTLAIALPALPQQAEVGYPVHFDISPPMRDIVAPPQAPDTTLSRPLMAVPRAPQVPQYDPGLQNTPGSAINATPGVNFDGVGVPNSCNCAPPDTNMAVGPNHIVQWVNTSYAVYDKAGAVLKPPTAGNSFWAGFGGPCQTSNSGDPIAQYDAAADRWVMSQLALSGGFFGPNYQCFAVSTSGDPMGTYARYAYTFGSDLNDYPKIGVWPVAYTGSPRGAYFASYNIFAFGGAGGFTGPRPCAYNRDKMLSGTAGAEQVCFNPGNSFGSLLPSDLDGGGATSGTPAPPAGEPNFYFDYGTNELLMWKFTPNFTTPASSTFTGPTHIAVNAFSALCGGGTCVPQQGTTQQLDTLADRLMYRNSYRNFGDHEAVLVSHAVTAGSGGGARWYEIRSPNATPTVFQQGTFAPDSGYRWMNSIASDKNGDIAIGYSVSSSSMHPAIRYTGREPADALGTMQSENSIIEGAGSQTGGLNRWGDYSAMRIDPTDDCTFWYTTEYIPADGSFNWHTRVGSFKFNGCGGPPPPPPPNPPSNLTATAVSASEIDLAWQDNSDNEDGFKIERCQNAGCTNFVQIALVPANTTSYQDLLLSSCTLYRYRVRAFNLLGGNSSYSNTAEATTAGNGPSGTITLTTTSPSSTEIDLNWNDATGENSYDIYRCQGVACTPTTKITSVPADSISYADTGLSPNTQYCYKVVAVNGCGTDESNASCATTQQIPTPNAPSNLTATAGRKGNNAFVNLAWTDNSNNETNFAIDRCTGASCTNFAQIATVGTNVTTYRDNSVARRTTYRYQVRATNAGGSSAPSNPASATTN